MSGNRTLLVFFTSRTSGPARRMESLLAHIARKERGRLEVKKVDVDERPEIAERFRISRRGPLPYASAIAAGAFIVLFKG